MAFLSANEMVQRLIELFMRLDIESIGRFGMDDLERVVEEIDRNMLGYWGEAKSRLDQLRTANTRAAHSLSQSVNEIFELSVSMQSTLDTVLSSPRQLDDWELMICGPISRELASGPSKANESLYQLNQVNAPALKDHILAMQMDLKHDFSQDGAYGQRMRQLNELIADGVKCEVPSDEKEIAIVDNKFNKRLVNRAKKWLKKFKKPDQKPVYEKELMQIESLKLCLDENFENAIRITDQLMIDLEQLKGMLEKLSKIEFHDTDIETLMVSQEPRNDFVQHLTKLRRTCLSYNQQRMH